MINVNGANSIKSCNKELENEIEENPQEDNNNNLIGILKPVDIMNSESQQGFNRVHVLCCSQCAFLTISIESLHQHLKTHHSISNDVFNELTIYSCQECQCVSTELKLIQEHIKMFHEIPSENISPKPICEKSMKKSKSLKIHRKNVPSKLFKKQLKIRKKIISRKSNINANRIFFPDEDDDNLNQSKNGKSNYNSNEYQLKKEMEMATYNEKIELERPTFTNDENNENDPLDMSITSITCPFKGIKTESVDRALHQIKQEFLLTESVESFINNNNNNNNNNINNNNIINNPLLSNPQTCIELIKLTIGQMLAKSNEQSRLPIPGFNPASFLQPQFQLPSNIIPLLLPTLAPPSNSNSNGNQSELSFSTQNPDIETILSNLTQHNILKNISSNSFESNHHMMSHQQSTMFLNHKSARSSPNMTKNLFIENIPKNGNGALSPIYSSKKSNENQTKHPQKRQFKKNQLQSRNRNGHSENLNYLQKSDQNNENLFNRSFLDSSLTLETKPDPIDLNKVLEKHDSSCDLFDSHINHSNKSSPGGLASDKPHRQNFTSQQNRILSDWFFTHCDKPYPSTEDTKELSQLSGLTYSQVKKWFANKRARSSLNKKGHKNYCLITPAESTMDEMGNNELCSDGILAISPSSGSQNAYNTSNIKTSSSQHTSSTPLDYTQLHQEDPQSPEK